MIQFKENAWTDKWKDGWKDRQTLFYRTLPATTKGPIKKLEKVARLALTLRERFDI